MNAPTDSAVPAALSPPPPPPTRSRKRRVGLLLLGAVVVAGGAVVLGGTEVPDGCLMAGVPAKVRRALTAEERRGLVANAEIYLDHTRTHAAAQAR